MYQNKNLNNQDTPDKNNSKLMIDSRKVPIITQSPGPYKSWYFGFAYILEVKIYNQQKTILTYIRGKLGNEQELKHGNYFSFWMLSYTHPLLIVLSKYR